MENVKKNRIIFLDVLRFLCIVVVIFNHFLMDVSIIHNMHDLTWLYTLVFDMKNFNLGMCVIVLYFFISGASLMLSSKKYIFDNDKFDITRFYKDRLIRILIPFYIVYVMYFIFRYCTLKFFPSDVSGALFGKTPKLYAFIYTLCGVDEYLNSEGIATFSLGIGEWFLGCIIFCYLFFPYIYKCYTRKPLLTFILFTIYFFVIQFYLSKFQTKQYTNFFNHIYNFFLGMVLINPKCVKIYVKYKKFFIPIFSFIILFCILYNKYYIPIFLNVKNTFQSILVFILFYYLEPLLQKMKNLKIFIIDFTKISFEIFLVHHSVIYEVDRLFKYGPVDKKLFIIILLDVILIYLMAKIVHKINSIVVKK